MGNESMWGRILDFSQTGVKLRLEYRRLLINQGERRVDTVPMGDIAVVILAHAQISVSLGALQGLLKAGAAVVVCDQKSIPQGLLLPLTGHHLSARRTRLQALVPKPVLKRLWRQIVRKKIEFQAALLRELFQDDGGLRDLANEVKSGDTDNREGQAAKRYWSGLFGETGFRRDYEGKDPINAALNYGYGVLRAIVARATVATGLCPCFGIFHHSKYDPFALVEDLMELFRPTVDGCVYRLNAEKKLDGDLTPATKSAIIRQVTGRYHVDGFQETIFETTSKMAESLVRVYSREKTALTLPTTFPLGPVDMTEPVVRTTVGEPEGPPGEPPF